MTTPHPVTDVTLFAFELHDRLRKAMEVAHVSNVDMAEYLGVSKFTISRYINGAQTPALGILRLWSMRTGAPLEWLQTGKTPGGDDPDGGNVVGYQGLEPRTRWFGDKRRLAA
nr:MAG TPA: helix-turn-helix domain protein [Bacteriophage sp.]